MNDLPQVIFSSLLSVSSIQLKVADVLVSSHF